MARRFIVRPLAEADLEDAARWYEDERPGLAERFLEDVDQTLARIRERPFQFPSVLGQGQSTAAHLPVRGVLSGVQRNGRRARGAALEEKSEGVARTYLIAMLDAARLSRRCARHPWLLRI